MKLLRHLLRKLDKIFSESFFSLVLPFPGCSTLPKTKVDEKLTFLVNIRSIHSRAAFNWGVSYSYIRLQCMRQHRVS